MLYQKIPCVFFGVSPTQKNWNPPEGRPEVPSLKQQHESKVLEFGGGEKNAAQKPKL